MGLRHEFWQLSQLADVQLLASLSALLRTQRRSLAEVVAHLGEVEERRLHLHAAHASMFDYCVRRLGMSEDEACRRIELARLARLYPVLFEELASGRISLSVALILKPVLSASNHLELLGAARGLSMRRARELVAARFPRPDTPSSIRKLPERRERNEVATPPLAEREQLALADPPAPGSALNSPASASVVAGCEPLGFTDVDQSLPALAVESAPLVSGLRAPVVERTVPALDGSLATSLQAPAPPGSPQCCDGNPPSPTSQAPGALRPHRDKIEPLSERRYRVQFTADDQLKAKLELACDLLRHAHPSGGFAPVLSRALDLLLEQLAQRRFGAKKRRPGVRTSMAPVRSSPTAPEPSHPSRAATTLGDVGGSTADGSDCISGARVGARALSEAWSSEASSASPAGESRPSPACAASVVGRASRRSVIDRDGLGCSWVGPDGSRCGATAWLEFDHVEPAGKGGCGEAHNLRQLCRAHNQLAAEQHYGREHVARAIAERRSQRA